ncbi:hypothetical protein H2200_002867 [Cladophialophora chaetospira]|uniref:CST complex subunit Stn1 N-terminal domain-containing protein n=1 Tax=Cladophialophora chaetospira TaxID=386627 RepID=A0AA38XGH8_9EURO|nr:hypothetical protein H2200_002867 [Cladophialophora chaetospira]
MENRSRATLQAHAQPSETANQLAFYPAYTFKASPTWSKWVKLTCHDIHTVLKPHEKYANVTTFTGHASAQDERRKTTGRNDAPLLLFYLNHPIQFVQVIGVVVVLEEYFEKFWLFTIDDSSGSTIDVICPKPEKERPSVTAQPVTNVGSTTTQRANTKATKKGDPIQDEETTAEQLLQSTLSRLTIGTVVQAKGTLSTFRQTRQLSLLRLNILPSTTHELALISSRSQFCSSTLSKPWVVSREEQRRLCLEAQGDRDEEIEWARKRRKHEQKKRDREERHRKTIGQDYEREEEERKQEAEEARKAGEEWTKTKKRSRQEEHRSEEAWTTVE